MIFKWTSESIIAAAAVAISTLGGVTTTAIHWGSVNTQIQNVQTAQAASDTKVEKLSVDSTEQKIHNARVEQSLADVIARLDDIQTQVRKPQHGNHE